MNKNILIVLGVLVVVGGGIYFMNSNNMSSSLSKEEDKMMQKDGQGIMEQGSMKVEDSKMMQGENTTGGDSAMMNKEEVMTDKKEEIMMVKSGTFEEYSASKIARASSTHDVVLFFDASWCPTCKAVKKDINANLSNIPNSLSILDVDYDNSVELKKKYGVTYQHTFVQVDKDGNLIKKWSGSPTLASLVKEVK